MKTLITLFILAVLFGCQKDVPTPAAPPPAVNNSPTPKIDTQYIKVSAVNWSPNIHDGGYPASETVGGIPGGIAQQTITYLSSVSIIDSLTNTNHGNKWSGFNLPNNYYFDMTVTMNWNSNNYYGSYTLSLTLYTYIPLNDIGVTLQLIGHN